MKLDKDQLLTYLHACRGAAGSAAEYNNYDAELFYDLQAKKLEIFLRLPLEERRAVIDYRNER